MLLQIRTLSMQVFVYMLHWLFFFFNHFLAFWLKFVMVSSVKDANMLVFVTPHQFMEGICKRLVGKVKEDAQGISLIKGMEVKMEGPCMISTLISEQLGINCCVLMGANIANEVILCCPDWFALCSFRFEFD